MCGEVKKQKVNKNESEKIFVEIKKHLTFISLILDFVHEFRLGLTFSKNNLTLYFV